MTVFSISPGSRLNRKALKELTGMPNIVLDNTLFSLINSKLITKEKNLFSLNFKSKGIKKIIEIAAEEYNKFKQLPLKEFFMINDILWEILKTKKLGEVYLFGSYAKLIFTKSSDIDIALISDEANKSEIEKKIRKLERKHKKTIEVHYFTKKFYKNKRDPLVKEILQHGIKLI